MATNNALNNNLNGATGTGSFVGSTSPTLVTPAIGTPSSGTLTNCTGLPVGGISGLGTNVATALAATLNATTGLAGLTIGTFTPGVAFGGGTTGITYTTQTGKYLQFGNIVLMTGAVLLSNKGSSTGAVTLTGFPVASVTPPSIIFADGQSMTINSGNLFLIFNNGDTTCNLLYQQTGTVNGSYSNTDFTNTTQISFTGFYFTA
jgi:hypothetical protein